MSTSRTGELTWTATEDSSRHTSGAVQVIDGNGGYASQIITFNVTQPVQFKNHRPAITSAPIADAFAGELYRYDVQAFDLDGDRLSYSLSSAPEGMSIDPVTGKIGWRPEDESIRAAFRHQSASPMNSVVSICNHMTLLCN